MDGHAARAAGEVFDVEAVVALLDDLHDGVDAVVDGDVGGLPARGGDPSADLRRKRLDIRRGGVDDRWRGTGHVLNQADAVQPVAFGPVGDAIGVDRSRDGAGVLLRDDLKGAVDAGRVREEVGVREVEVGGIVGL